MPKEVIYDRETPFHSLIVGWSRDGGVGITAHRDAPQPDSLEFKNPFPNTLLCRQDGEAEPQTATNSDLTMRAESVDVHLDRDGINRLIRTLRRARDAAFGADA